MQPGTNQNPYYPPREPLPQESQQVGVTPPTTGGASFKGISGGGTPWGWIITVIILSVLLVSAAGFGFWAFAGRQDYKNNSDEKAAAAVEIAKKETTEENNKRFAEELKNPLKTYTGPESFGSVAVQYPKTWSAYIANQGLTSGSVLDIYFHPDVVPAISTSSGGSRPAVALRVQVLNQSYTQTVNALKSSVDSGQVTAEPYTLPKVPNQTGTLFRGKLANELVGTQIVLPLRDKSLVINTDTDQFLPDFNKYILPNLSFVP